MRRLAIVTGASQGIGREAALLLALADCDLVLTARNEEALKSVAAECESIGACVSVFPFDLSEPGNCTKLIEMAKPAGVDHYPVLVNNAGIAEFGSFDQQEWAVIQQHVQLNFVAGMELVHAALPWMLEVGGGQVINVLSMSARVPFSGAAAYCASKAALHMFGRVLALEYRARGVRVTSLIPGSADTPLWDNKPWKPESADMLPAKAVAEAIRDIVLAPLDRNFDEITLMPPNGIL